MDGRIGWMEEMVVTNFRQYKFTYEDHRSLEEHKSTLIASTTTIKDVHATLLQGI